VIGFDKIYGCIIHYAETKDLSGENVHQQSILKATSLNKPEMKF